MPEGRNEFRALQYQFTAHMRDPARNPAPPDVEDRRLGIYRDLLYRNVEGFLANSFPVVREILDDDVWHQTIRHYFSSHTAHTPLFPKMPQEFLHYLAALEAPVAGLEFLKELAHYEWLELEASLDKRDVDEVLIDRDTNCMDGIPVLNPTARLHAYTYPVHQISPDIQPTEAPNNPTYLVVYRDRSDKVGFMQLNPVTARLAELISVNANSNGHMLLEQIAREMNHPDARVVVNGGLEILNSLLQQEVILGARQLPRAIKN